MGSLKKEIYQFKKRNAIESWYQNKSYLCKPICHQTILIAKRL